MRDIYNIEPIDYPFKILPTYYHFIDETSFRSPEGDVIGKDLLTYIWGAFLNAAYWAQECIRSIKGLLTHGADYNFISFNYPLYIHNTDRRLTGVVSVGNIPGTRGDINVVFNGDMRIRAINDSTAYTDYTKPGIWGWYKGCYVPSIPSESSYHYLKGIDNDKLFNLPEYKIRNENIYMIVPYKIESEECANAVGTTFEITKGNIAELSITGFVSNVSTNVQLKIGLCYYTADGTNIDLDEILLDIDTTENEYTTKINIPDSTRVMSLILYPQELKIDGTSYEYNLWIRNVSIKDGQLPNHLDKYDDNFVLDKSMLESKIYEVDLLNPMLYKFWDAILGGNILNFTALSNDYYTWAESIATNLKLMWRPMVEASIYNLLRGCAAVAYSWFSPHAGFVERVYPDSESHIWDGSLIKLTTDTTTYYRYSVLSPIYVRNEGVNKYDLIHHAAINILAPESAHLYSYVWMLQDETIVNIAGKDDLCPKFKLKPHKFVLVQFNDRFNLQSERFYEMLKYGQRAMPPGYKFLITPGIVNETIYWTTAMTKDPASWKFDTTINDVFLVSPATITISYIIGINNTSDTKSVVVRGAFYDKNDNILFSNESIYNYTQEDYGELFLVSVDIPISSGSEHIAYEGYIITELESYPEFSPGEKNITFIWEGPLLGIRREYWGNPQVRLWNLPKN